MAIQLDKEACGRLADLIQRGIATGKLHEYRMAPFLWPSPGGGFRGHVLTFAAMGARETPDAIIAEVQRFGSWRIACDVITGVSRGGQDLALPAVKRGRSCEQVAHLLRTDPTMLLPAQPRPFSGYGAP